ncbi:MAG: hypothetical protein M1814_006454 [Vezdaea aestivalis]|nr:MAG: hypothetical protein M1814_006454 [Vezdaea aestivalis]
MPKRKYAAVATSIAVAGPQNCKRRRCESSLEPTRRSERLKARSNKEVLSESNDQLPIKKRKAEDTVEDRVAGWVSNGTWPNLPISPKMGLLPKKRMRSSSQT